MNIIETDQTEKFTKRDSLVNNENGIMFEEFAEPHKGNKFFGTFPYPYQNGTLHLGHAYTLSKLEFQARFMKLKGRNVLFPFGFHGTGMPIVACSNKLKESLDKLAFNGENIRTTKIESLEKDDQIRILFNMNVSRDEIPLFVDPHYWLKYFPEKNTQDLQRLGVMTDFRRSFITTDMNPHYDSFVKWQFNILNKKSFLKFGKKPLIFSPKDNQPCADHDRKQGCEGIEPLQMKIVMAKCENMSLFVTVDLNETVSRSQKKSIIVNKQDAFYFVRTKCGVCVTNETFVSNYQYQIDDRTDLCVEKAFTGDFLVGKSVTLDNQNFIIQSSENKVNGSGIKLLFKNCNGDAHERNYCEGNDENTFIYYEPKSQVISRTGDVCVVAIADQWFLDYSDTVLKEKINKYIDSNFECSGIKTDLLNASNWITFWPCSRSYGLGTKLLNTDYMIDSLSDSTIYMAYYTIAHKISKIPVDYLTNEIWDYIFAITDVCPQFKGDSLVLNEMRNEFLYWYPMDLRVSGKDLIGNHLIMCLYTHYMIWGDKWGDRMMPNMFFVNGHLKLNGEKMSKSTGNFMTLNEALSKYGADSTRFTLAGSGSNLDDGNFTELNAKESILILFNEREWILDCIKKINECTTNNSHEEQANDVWNDIFEAEINECMLSAEKFYETLDYQKVVICGFYKMLSIRDKQRVRIESGLSRFSQKHMQHYIENFLLLLYPICPYFVENIWELFPKAKFSKIWPSNITINTEHIYFRDLYNGIVSEINSSIANMEKRLAKKGEKKILNVKITHVSTFFNLENEIIEEFKNKNVKSTNEILKLISNKLTDKKQIGLAGKFIGYVQSRIEKYGDEWFRLIDKGCYELLSNNVMKFYSCTSSHIVTFEQISCSNETLFRYHPENPIIKCSIN